MTIGQRLKQLREENNLTLEEVAAKIGVAHATIYKYEKEIVTNIPMSMIETLAKIYNVTPSYVMGWEEKPARTYKTVSIPVLGNVAAGEPIEAIEDILDYVDIPEEMASKGNYFGLRIKGHSMEPRIWEGDTVIVKQQDWVEDNQIAVVIINGYDATCKKFHQTESGVSLMSLNPIYDPIYFSNEELENEPLKVIGRVVQIRSDV